jgi:DNA-binding transcriptional MocR family regulator
MLSLQASKISPLPEMQKAFEEAVKHISTSFEYPNPSGNENLREQIKEFHPHWQGEVLITNSATEATYLALSQIAGGKLALNVPSYFGVIRQAKDLNIEVIEWETVDDLEKIENCDAVLLTSNFTPPIGKSFSDEDKHIISQFANAKNALVIEDNAYEFLSFNGEPLTSIKTNKSININSFSKLLSPALRLGFIMAEGEMFKKVRSKKITMNLSSSPISQEIISNILQDKYIIKIWQKELKERAILLHEEIKKQLNIDIEMPDGGSFIKLPLNPDIDLDAFIAKAKENGLLLDSNSRQYLNNRPQPYLRLHLGAIAKEDIKRAVGIFKTIQNQE